MNSVLRFETHSDEETRALGRELAAQLPERGVVLLIGESGRGQNDARQRESWKDEARRAPMTFRARPSR